MTKVTKVVAPKTWKEKVMAVLGMTEEGKVGNMQTQLSKLLKKQIKMRKDKIADIKRQTIEKVEEMQEILEEIKEDAELAFITVDTTKIVDVSARKAYAEVLNYNFDRALDSVESQEDAIRELQADAEATIEVKEKEIARFELKLSKI